MLSYIRKVLKEKFNSISEYRGDNFLEFKLQNKTFLIHWEQSDPYVIRVYLPRIHAITPETDFAVKNIILEICPKLCKSCIIKNDVFLYADSVIPDTFYTEYTIRRLTNSLVDYQTKFNKELNTRLQTYYNPQP